MASRQELAAPKRKQGAGRGRARGSAQEKRLQTREPNTASLFAAYRSGRDATLRDQLICMHLDLVQAIARRFSGMGESTEDLVQEGTMGLINAVDWYEPRRGVKFTTYATHLIVGQIQHYLRDRGRLIRQPAWVQELAAKVVKATEALQHQLHRAATPQEIAQHMGISESTVERVLKAREGAKVSSIDAADEAEGGTPAINPEKLRLALPASHMTVEDRVLLQSAVSCLKDLERKVVRYFFFQDLNQTEIAKRLGISVNYASYLLRRAQSKLRQVFEQAAAAPAPAAQPQAPALATVALDAETGLPTVAYLKDRLHQEVARVQRYAHKGQANLSLMLLQAGGGTVQELVPMVRKTIRAYDVLARISETALGLIVPGVGAQAHVIAQRLLQVASPQSPASLGYAIYPTDADTAEGLYLRAQRALARASASGSGSVVRAGQDG